MRELIPDGLEIWEKENATLQAETAPESPLPPGRQQDLVQLE